MTGNLNFRPNGFKICNRGYTFPAEGRGVAIFPKTYPSF